MRTSRHRPRTRGQIVVIFALAIVAFVGMCAIVIDVSWFWSNSLRMQRAADAAALAGVIRLPGREDLAIDLARAEAQKNGYTNGAGGVIVDVHKDAANNRRLRVKISGPVNTFFARVLGIQQHPGDPRLTGRVRAPGPDGQPGELLRRVRLVRHCATATPSVCHTAGGTTVYRRPPRPPASRPATSRPRARPPEPGRHRPIPPREQRSGDVDHREPVSDLRRVQHHPEQLCHAIEGIEVSAEMSKTGTGATCQIQYELSWDNRTTSTTRHRPEALTEPDHDRRGRAPPVARRTSGTRPGPRVADRVTA